MSQILSERVNIRQALVPAANRYNANPATDVFNLKLYETVAFVINKGAGATGTAVVTIEECDDAAGTNPVAIPFRYRQHAAGAAQGALTSAAAAGFTFAAGVDRLAIIEVEAASLDSVKSFVRMQLTEGVVDVAVVAGVLAILGKPRYVGADGDLDPGLA